MFFFDVATSHVWIPICLEKFQIVVASSPKSGVADPLPSRGGKEVTCTNALCSRQKNGAVGNDHISWRIQMEDVTVRAGASWRYFLNF